jgi:hypothetical protein
MPKENIILLIIILVIAVAIISAITIYYPFQHIAPKSAGLKKETIEPPTITFEQQMNQIKKDFPEVITGTIHFLDTKNSLKTTIKTDDGKEYTLWPSQPESVYESFGAKDGGKVEIQAKAPQDGKVQWELMKPR